MYKCYNKITMNLLHFLKKLDCEKILRCVVFRTAKIYPDELYLKLLFPLRTGYKLNLKNPRTFNEKLKWLKNNRKNSVLLHMKMICNLNFCYHHPES